MESEFLQAVGSFVQNIGLPVSLVIFFVYWSWKREQAMAERLNALEESQRHMLETTIADNTKAYLENTVALVNLSRESKQNTDVLSRIVDELRVCLEKASASNFKLRSIKGEKQ